MPRSCRGSLFAFWAAVTPLLLRDAAAGAAQVPRRSHRQARISTEDALDQLPPSVGNLFLEFARAPAANKGAQVLAELNAVYQKAQAAEDASTLDCVDENDNLTQSITSSKASIFAVESQLIRMDDRVRSLHSGFFTAEQQSAREQFENLRSRCELRRIQYTAELANLTEDLTIARDIADKAMAGCATGGGDVPPLVECTMPDGAIIATFKDHDMRVLAGKLGNLTGDLLSYNLDAALRRSHGATSFVAIRSRRHQLRRHHTRRFLHKRTILHHLCTDVAAPTCAAFADGVATFLGGVQDAIDARRAAVQADAERCEDNLGTRESLVAYLHQEADKATSALADAVSQQASLAALQRQQHAQLVQLSEEVGRARRRCSEQIATAAETKCAAKGLWREIQASGTTGTFIGDCEVTSWISEPCSQQCGASGTRTLTRRVVVAPNGQQECPVLALNRTCNERPCAVDVVMGRWQEWSACSRQCGGGTRTRRRDVVRQAEDGGLPAGESVQMEVCNAEACDADCELEDWTPWSNCSRVCLGGHKTRTRDVRRPALGRGRCPKPDDTQFREAAACGKTACDEEANTIAAPHCASALDLVLLLDSSGSVGAEGYEATKQFATKLVERTSLEAETPGGVLLSSAGKVEAPQDVSRSGARLGVVSFRGTATVVEDLTAERSKLSTQIAALQWTASGSMTHSSTNTAAALAVARTMLESHTAPAATPVVALLTDGPGVSARLAAAEAEHLRAMGARVVLVAVGPSAAKTLGPWASWPRKENVVEVASYKALKEESTVTALLAAICPILAFA